MRTFGSLLEEYRIENNLSKKKAAEIFGWTRMYYARFENGNTYPTPRNIKKFVSILGIPEEELLKIIEEERKNKRKHIDEETND